MSTPTRIATGDSNPKERKIPDLQKLQDGKVAERQAELARLSGIESEQAPKEPEAVAPPKDWDTEIEALDPELRNQFAQRVYNQYNQQISQEFGDIIPLIGSARTDANLRKNLKALAEDQELRSILADENAPKRLKRLADKKLSKLYEDDEFAEFAATEAYPVYQQYAEQIRGSRPAEATGQRSPELERIEALEKQINEGKDQSEQQRYVTTRVRERDALSSQYPVFRENAALRERVIGRAEQDFESRAYRAGIDVSNPHWHAHALRQGIQPPAYLEYFNAETSWLEKNGAQALAAPTGGPGDSQATRSAAIRSEGAKPTGKPKSLTDYRERGIAALNNLKAEQQKQGVTRG